MKRAATATLAYPPLEGEGRRVLREARRAAGWGARRQMRVDMQRMNNHPTPITPDEAWLRRM
jgi:hypothetical protein